MYPVYIAQLSPVCSTASRFRDTRLLKKNGNASNDLSLALNINLSKVPKCTLNTCPSGRNVDQFCYMSSSFPGIHVKVANKIGYALNGLRVTLNTQLSRVPSIYGKLLRPGSTFHLFAVRPAVSRYNLIDNRKSHHTTSKSALYSLYTYPDVQISSRLSVTPALISKKYDKY